jgi:hypothetical protein
MDSVSEQLERALEQLGNSPALVGETLKSHGVMGARNTVRILNPVVRFISAQLAISSLGMDVMVPGSFRVKLLDGTTLKVSLPRPVLDFLRAFNHGHFPELEISVSSAPPDD